MPFNNIIEKHLNELKDTIKAEMRNKGLYNSGETSDSLDVKNNTLFGSEVILYLDQGRKPGKHPPPQNIVEWVRSKLGINDLKKSRQIAYLVGRKISEKGTEIYRNKRKGLQLEDKINTTIDNIYKEIPDYVIGEIRTILNKK